MRISDDSKYRFAIFMFLLYCMGFTFSLWKVFQTGDLRWGLASAFCAACVAMSVK